MFVHMPSRTCLLIANILVGLVIFVGLITIVQAESVYPPSQSVELVFNLEQYRLDQNDTLVVRYHFLNINLARITGLYFSDKWPSSFDLMSHHLSLNNQPLSAEYVTQSADTGLGQYQSGYWMVQRAGQSFPSIIPGDRISLILEFSGFSPGSYSLPFHSTVFLGDSQAYFSFGDTVIFEVTEASDLDGDGVLDAVDNCPWVYNPDQIGF